MEKAESCTDMRERAENVVTVKKERGENNE